METLPHAPVLAQAPVLARFGHAISDPTRARILLALAAAPAYPSDLADAWGVSRQNMSNHLTCLRGCGLVVAVPDGRRNRYELVDGRLGSAITDLIGVVLAVDPACCAPDGRCLA
ncbi:metalloregulator ArsR/SmtB family transcription factor (plasmid) [Arthrobacter sp. FW305-BF8]|uniref:ArsR/SmtB family transcription factor n=1 Tax=Arthrobacter sp. FW305-BF8 TaxID=2879617 RepID=UPI001F025D90|nr:metalloregulator ArsR/SmtB family transcription factor [Arthrobacter sp. FW305-BF8]UKA56730.1 metalloregulator ArsR/SmtB family transcription factor [Arthrobacter sp. FW305-BF8]